MTGALRSHRRATLLSAARSGARVLALLGSAALSGCASWGGGLVQPLDFGAFGADQRPAAAERAPARSSVLRAEARRDDTAAAARPAALPAVPESSVPAPRWTRDSWWLYSDGYGLVVRDVQGGKTTFERLDDPRQWFTRRGFLREEAQSATTYRAVVYRTLAPDAGRELVPGRPLAFRREFMSGGELKVHNTSWTVEGRETITVPAGEFDCWVLVMRTLSITSGWSGFERWWYCPSIQNYARLEFQYGAMPISSRVLTAYQLVPAGAEARRPPPRRGYDGS